MGWRFSADTTNVTPTSPPRHPWFTRRRARIYACAAGLAAGLITTVVPLATADPVWAATEKQLQAEIDAIERELSVTTNRIENVEAKYDEALQVYFGAELRYRERLAEVYMAGGLDQVGIFSSVDDLSSLIDSVTLLDTVVDHDKDVLRGWRNAALKAEQAEAALDEERDTKQRLYQRLWIAQAALSEYQHASRVNAIAEAQEAQDESAEEQSSGSLASYGTTAFPFSPLPSLLPGFTLPGTATPPADMPSDLEPTGIIETGQASWYGPGFHGNTTANGEKYDMYAMTAAHKTLPFGTWVKVTTSTGRAVFVRINDRGPYVDGRIIDLSYAASQLLGVSGVAPVQIEVFAAPGNEGVTPTA